MKAMLLREIASLSQNSTPLSFQQIAEPQLNEGEILLHVTRCGVCHTELDEIEGRTPPPHLPVVLGHQVVGNIMESGGLPPMQERAPALQIGQRVGVAWIASACGHCQYCLSAQENLCPEFKRILYIRSRIQFLTQKLHRYCARERSVIAR